MNDALNLNIIIVASIKYQLFEPNIFWSFSKLNFLTDFGSSAEIFLFCTLYDVH